MNDIELIRTSANGYECPRCAALAHQSENLYASDCMCMYAVEEEWDPKDDMEYCVCECSNCWIGECPFDSLCQEHAIAVNDGGKSGESVNSIDDDDENIPDLIDNETGEIVRDDHGAYRTRRNYFDFAVSNNVSTRIPEDVFPGFCIHVEPSTGLYNALQALQIRDFSQYLGDDVTIEDGNASDDSWSLPDDNERCVHSCNCNWCSTDVQEVY